MCEYALFNCAYTMLLISQLRLPIDHADDALRSAVCQVLHIQKQDIVTLEVDQRATDARRGIVEFSYAVKVQLKNEEEVLKTANPNRVRIAPDDVYHELDSLSQTPAAQKHPKVVIVGTGPVD